MADIFVPTRDLPGTARKFQGQRGKVTTTHNDFRLFISLYQRVDLNKYSQKTAERATNHLGTTQQILPGPADQFVEGRNCDVFIQAYKGWMCSGGYDHSRGGRDVTSCAKTRIFQRARGHPALEASLVFKGTESDGTDQWRVRVMEQTTSIGGERERATCSSIINHHQHTTACNHMPRSLVVGVRHTGTGAESRRQKRAEGRGQRAEESKREQ
ncbi:hypothetical protein B0T09DRAFT_350890 [Sordaria sp. MPI-SDFR-AT-0083]|nr:hypothetical protein B0T09DRAFT_350890 [Sordaria sp. MPI-SDFR-AT-0083]